MEGHIQDEDHLASDGVGKPEGRDRNPRATDAGHTQMDPAGGGKGNSRSQKTAGATAQGGLAGIGGIGVTKESGEGGTYHPVEEAAGGGKDAENADVELAKLSAMRITRRPRTSS